MEAMSHARELEVVKEGLIDHSGMYKHVSGRPRCCLVAQLQKLLPLPVDWSRAAQVSRGKVVPGLFSLSSHSALLLDFHPSSKRLGVPSDPHRHHHHHRHPLFFLTLLVCAAPVFVRAGDDLLFPL